MRIGLLTSRREFTKELAVGAGALAVTGSLGAWAATAARKYENYFHELKFKKGQGGPGCADSVIHMNGKDLNNRNTNFSFGYYGKPGAYQNEGLAWIPMRGIRTNKNKANRRELWGFFKPTLVFQLNPTVITQRQG
jgi:hypothetical protein